MSPRVFCPTVVRVSFLSSTGVMGDELTGFGRGEPSARARVGVATATDAKKINTAAASVASCINLGGGKVERTTRAGALEIVTGRAININMLRQLGKRASRLLSRRALIQPMLPAKVPDLCRTGKKTELARELVVFSGPLRPSSAA
jgi:hypothetical protein